MSGSRLIVMAILIAGAAAAGGWWLLWTDAARFAHPTAAQLRDLQAQADAACLCARRTGDSRNGECWAEFERSLTRYEYSEEASMCMDGSTHAICFEQSGTDCILRDRGYGACSAWP